MRAMNFQFSVPRRSPRLWLRSLGALTCLLLAATAMAAPSGPAPLKSADVVESLRLAGLDDDAIRRALMAYPAYLERAMAAQRERIEPLRTMQRAGRDADPAAQLKSAQEVARAMRSASEAVEAAERQLIDALVATIPEGDADTRQRVDTVLNFRLSRRAAATWMRDRLVGLSPGASAADPREVISRIALADDVRARAIDRISQYERIAAPVMRQWRESCADVPVARARAADADPMARRIAAAAPIAGWSTQIGTQLRAMLADMREILPPVEYEQFRTSLLRSAYPSIVSQAARADRAMLGALKKAAKGEPDAQAAARNQQRYRDWTKARDARCDALMAAADSGVPAGPMMMQMLASAGAQQASRLADDDGRLAQLAAEMKALKDAAGESAGLLEGVEPADMMSELEMFLPDDLGIGAGESNVAVSVDMSTMGGGGDVAGPAGSSDASTTSSTTSVVISSAMAVGGDAAGGGGIDISGPVQIVAFTAVEGGLSDEPLEFSLGDAFEGEGLVSLEYSGGDELYLPGVDQNIDETRISRSMSAPRADPIGLPTLLAELRARGVPALSQPAELALRDSIEQYTAQHVALTRALAMEWSGRDPDADAAATQPATQKEQIQQAMQRGAEELRRASDESFIRRRFDAWQRAPSAYAQLEMALLDGVMQAIAIGATESQVAEATRTIDAMRERRALAVEQSLLAASGRPAALDMGGYAASLDLRALSESTPLSTPDKAAAASALNGYEPALTSLLAQRREAAVDIERTSQLMTSVALGQFSGVIEGVEAPINPDLAEAALARTRTRLDEATARGQSIGARLEEWQTAQSERLLGALTPAGRARAAAALTRAKHPTVARDSTTADPQIARAMSMVESDDALLQSVIAVAGGYQQAYDAIFAKLVEADAARQSALADLAAANAKSPPDKTAVDSARTRRSAATRELTRLRTERSELNARTVRALRAALGPERGQEIADLPARRATPRDRTPTPTAAPASRAGSPAGAAAGAAAGMPAGAPAGAAAGAPAAAVTPG